MEKIEFECPDCGEKNKLILMGYDRAKFDKKCQNCKADLEILKKSDKISVESKKKVVKKETAIPSAYKKYKPEESNEKTAVFIAILILTSSLMGLSTGWSLSNAFEIDYSDYEKINLEIVVLNNTSNLENVTITFNNEEIKDVNKRIVCSLFNQPLDNPKILAGIFDNSGKILDIFESH